MNHEIAVPLGTTDGTVEQALQVAYRCLETALQLNHHCKALCAFDNEFVILTSVELGQPSVDQKTILT
jgi:hypothetical protein